MSSREELQFSERIDNIIHACGHETFLSQYDGECKSDMTDCERMDWCDAILFLFDGDIPDEGIIFKLGYCFAKGKRCIGYKTDARSAAEGFCHITLYGAPVTIVHHEDDLVEFFSKKFALDTSHEEINEDSIIFADMDMALPIAETETMEHNTISYNARPELLNLILDAK